MEKLKNFNKSFENATNLHKQGKINEALEIYLELQKKDNNNSQLLFQIGNAYLQKGSVELSIGFYRKVSEIDKYHFNNLNNLGGALATISKYAEAIDVFKKTLNIKPDYSDAYSNIGNCYLYIKDHKNSMVHVSGHPSKSELKKMYEWIKPDLIIPVHGEYQHLVEHAKFALDSGVESSILVEDGDVVLIEKQGQSKKLFKVHTGRKVLKGSRVLALDKGFMYVESSPLVRSSYHAEKHVK